AMSKNNMEMLLLRAVAKQPPLYDRTSDNYRKRLPCENSWDIVASETGESVNNCKRQWRQLRNSYTRFVNLSAQRKRNGQRRLSYPLAEELKFLDPHLHLADDGSDLERDSESRDTSLDRSQKAHVITADKASEDIRIRQDRERVVSQTKKIVVENQDKRTAKENSFEKVLEKPDKVTTTDNFLTSDNEAEVNVEENSEAELTGFGFNSEVSFQEPLTATSEKPSEGDSVESPASQSEFFIKQNNDPHLLVIGKKRANIAMDDSRDPLDGSDDDSIPSPSRRARRPIRASMSIKDVPIRRSEMGQRLTRLQRRKSLGGALQSNSPSPVKLSPVPRTSLPNKQGPVMVKTIPSSRDDIFPRPAPLDNALQKRSVGRPKKMMQPMMQRMKDLMDQHQSPNSSPQPSISVQPKSAMASKTNTSVGTSTPSSTSISSTTNRKTPETGTMVTFSPITTTISPAVSSPSSQASKSSVGTVVTPIVGATSTGPPLSVQPFKTLTKRCERSSQTESQELNTDEKFLEMIKPQMMEMNPRQKMMFKKKVFQSLMETFDDATDFPEAGELQHFNINTPSGFEHVSDPELRLVRELVSLVSAAKVTSRQPSPREPSPSAPTTSAGAKPAAPEVLRQTRVVPRQMVQRVIKPGSAVEVTTTPIMTGPGHEKKLYRILQMNGKSNGYISASMEELRPRESSESGPSGAIKVVHPTVVSPRAASVVAAVRPQGSTMNTFFGQPPSVAAIKTAQPGKVRMSRRYSVCGAGNPPPVPPSGQMPANASSLNCNLNPMEAAILKRRLVAPAQGMVPPSQRPRYSAGGGGQLVASPNGNSLLVRKPLGGSVSGINKQLSPVSGSSAPTKNPQITNVQGNAFNDFVQPASKSSAGSSVPSSPGLGEASSPQAAMKRNMVVANTKNTVQNEQQTGSRQSRSDSTETAATIAADDFSLGSLKREPLDHMDDQDILGI
ncbi:hypothetical protein KR074_004681, partial [Drosophila pseudoananassae]